MKTLIVIVLVASAILLLELFFRKVISPFWLRRLMPEPPAPKEPPAWKEPPARPALHSLSKLEMMKEMERALSNRDECDAHIENEELNAAVLRRDDPDEICYLIGHNMLRNSEQQRQLVHVSKATLLMILERYPEWCSCRHDFQREIITSQNSAIVGAMLEKVPVAGGVQPLLLDLLPSDFEKVMTSASGPGSVSFCKRLLASKNARKISSYICRYVLQNPADFVTLVNQGDLPDDLLMLYLQMHGGTLSPEAAILVYERCRIQESILVNSSVPWWRIPEISATARLFLLKEGLIEISPKCYDKIIAQKEREEILFLVNTSGKFFDEAEVALLETEYDEGIEAYKAKGHKLCFVARHLDALRLSKKA